ncbi:adp-ribose 1 phosphate phosphatase [Fusarium tjaetaba]|uniref:Adp-ribose 1 phosphate phosphatase n=1 Tax=Fusarium tjaetaba TaxID=1567544 RepID=A0A8H5QH60_9HYPO|nr:adp-ribose 1 phosphate phosphatase [Fusarium tjaetaba]KAF5614684.1 adp-ribose 1 phosphate phosphatase [Fusarium tjaetaba]
MASPIFVLETTSLNAIRSLPSDIYLVHATNCIAEWGAGIAAELATVFPAACKEYKKFCNITIPDGSRWPSRSLAGKCFIIPTQASDTARGAPKIHIVCLFTSYGYGRANPRTGKPGKDGAGKILAQTRAALKEMREQLEEEREQEADGAPVIYSPMFNSGAFKVPWESTSRLIEEEFEGFEGRWLIMAPP